MERVCSCSLAGASDGVDGEDLLVPNPNHHYAPESSSEDEESDNDGADDADQAK